MLKVCLQTDVSFPDSKGSTVGLSSSSPLEVKGMRLAVTHHLFCGCWGLRTEQINLRNTGSFHSTSHKKRDDYWSGLHLRDSYHHSSINGWFVNVRPCSLITSRLNQGAWVTPMLIISSPVLTDRVKDWRGEKRDERHPTATWNACMIWRGTDVVFVANVFVQRGVCVQSA